MIVLLLLCLPSKADNTNKVTVGLTIDSTVVVAESQSFGRRIDNVVTQFGLDYILLKFRDTTKSGKWLQFKGEIGAFSIEDSKLLWTYPFDYRNSSAYCTKAGVGIAKGNKFSMLDPNTGNVRWQGKFTPVQHVDVSCTGRNVHLIDLPGRAVIQEVERLIVCRGIKTARKGED